MREPVDDADSARSRMLERPVRQSLTRMHHVPDGAATPIVLLSSHRSESGGNMSSVAESARSFARDDRGVGTGPILVATDGRSERASVLAAARALANRSGASLQIVGVCPTLTPLVPDPSLLLGDEGLVKKLRSDLEHRVRVQSALEIGEDSDLRSPHVEIRDGDPAGVIGRLADERDAQLIVIGLGRHDLLERMFGDETALKVARVTHVPVLAIPPGGVRPPRSAIVG